MLDRFYERSAHLNTLLNTNPAEAVKQAREVNLNLDADEQFNLMGLRAAILVDGGTLTQQKDAIEEGLALFRELHSLFPTAHITYNLANGLVAATGSPPRDANWLNHQEVTRERRAEARRCFWKVAQDVEAELALRTQAWTNLANQFSSSYRLGEAHDGWLAALELDPENGVAASSAARNLLWLMSAVAVQSLPASRRSCWPRLRIGIGIESSSTLAHRLRRRSLRSQANWEIRHRDHSTKIHSSVGSSVNA